MFSKVFHSHILHRIRYIFLLICVAGLTVSCVDEETFDNTPEGNLEALWSIIDQHYCFLDYKAKSIGLDWDAVLVKYRARLSGKMSNEQLQEVLTDMLGELRDGHVNLYTSQDVSRYWSWYEDYPKNLDTELRDKYLGTDYKIAGGLKYRILDDNIGYIVYESFQNGIGEGNIDDALYYLRACNGLILDIRSNTGGSLEYAERLASHFTNEKVLVGYMSHKTGTGRTDFSTPRAEYVSPSTGYRWQKKVVVLTNRECYSATNTFVRDMLCFPGVTTMGDTTGGGSGMPFSSELPNGWSVRLSACPMYDKDMNQIEFGIAPTVACSLDSTAVSGGMDNIIEQARLILQ